jgi:ribosomal protein S13
MPTHTLAPATHTGRGKRHALGLPVNGQNTACNAKTARKFKRHVMYDVK